MFHLPRLAMLLLLLLSLLLLLRLVLRPIISLLPPRRRLLRFLCLSLHLLLLLFQFHPLLRLLLFRALGSVVRRRRSRGPLVVVAHRIIILSLLAPVSKARHQCLARSCQATPYIPYLFFPLAGVQPAHALPPPPVVTRPRGRPRPAVILTAPVDRLPPVPVHRPPAASAAQGAAGPPAGGPGEAAPAAAGQGAAVDQVIGGALKGPRALPDAVSGRRPFMKSKHWQFTFHPKFHRLPQLRRHLLIL